MASCHHSSEKWLERGPKLAMSYAQTPAEVMATARMNSQARAGPSGKTQLENGDSRSTVGYVVNGAASYSRRAATAQAGYVSSRPRLAPGSPHPRVAGPRVAAPR